MGAFIDGGSTVIDDSMQTTLAQLYRLADTPLEYRRSFDLGGKKNLQGGKLRKKKKKKKKNWGKKLKEEEMERKKKKKHGERENRTAVAHRSRSRVLCLTRHLL